MDDEHYLDALRLANRLNELAQPHSRETPPMRLPYGPRHGSEDLKGVGFRGPIDNDGHVVSEYSADRDFQYPSVYKGISDADLAAVLLHERMQPKGDDLISERLKPPPFPEDVDQRAYEAAQGRRDEGRSPFFEHGADEYPAWSPEQEWPEPSVTAPEERAGGGAIKKALALALEQLGPHDLERALNKAREIIPPRDPRVMWHGSGSGDLRGGASGLHLGTHEAARQALEARIGVPAEGSWYGTRPYGETMLMGKERIPLRQDGYPYVTGHNVHAPEQDYLAASREMPNVSRDVPMDPNWTPALMPYRITGEMKNTPQNPMTDSRANSTMQGLLTRDQARRGFYYGNEGEDAGSISAVVPGAQHVEPVDLEQLLRHGKYADGGEVDDREHFGPGGKAVEEALTLARRLGAKLHPEGSGYVGVPGKPSVVELPGYGRVEARPIPAIEHAGIKATRGEGKPITSFPPFNPAFAAKVAEAFEAMKHDPSDPAVKRAYEALVDDTMAQYRAAKDTGIDFHFLRPGEADPYAAHPGLGYADILENGRLVMFPTDQGFGSSADFVAENSPMLKRVGRVGDKDDAVVNDAFRIVHDLYGHHGPGNPFFRAPGEERAFQLHSQMFSPEALPAATTETRGQNSWVNYGPHGAANRAASGVDTNYADNKIGVLPGWAGAPTPDVGTDIEGYIRGLTGKAEGGALTETDPFDPLTPPPMALEPEPPRKEATLREHKPSLRERIMALLQGDERASPRRRRMAEDLTNLAYFTPGIGEAIAGDQIGRKAAEGDAKAALRALLGVLPGTGPLASGALKEMGPAKEWMAQGADKAVEKIMAKGDYDDVLALADRLHEHVGGVTRAHRGPGGGLDANVSYMNEPPPIPMGPEVPGALSVPAPVDRSGLDLPIMAQDPDQQIKDALRIADEHKAEQLRAIANEPSNLDYLAPMIRYATGALAKPEIGPERATRHALLEAPGAFKNTAMAAPGILKDILMGTVGAAKHGVEKVHQALPQGLGGEGRFNPEDPADYGPIIDLAGLAQTGSFAGTAPKGALRSGLSRTAESPLAATFEAENVPSVVASPRPGKGAHPAIVPEKGLKEGFDQPPEEIWNDQFGYETPDILGAGLPPVIQAPLHNEPRLDNIVRAMNPIFRSPHLHQIIEDVTGLSKGNLKITPTVGTWLGEREPSFVFEHPDMTPESANKLAELLGFGMQQDAAVAFHHNLSKDEGFRTALIGTGKKLTSRQVDAIAREAAKENLDFTLSKDGKAVKFLFMGDEDKFEPFADSVQRVAEAAKMPELYHARSKSDLIGAHEYLPEILNAGRKNGVAGLGNGEAGLQGGAAGSPDLLGRIIDHFLAPFGRAIAGEGYRLSPQRLGENYGLAPEHVERMRKALLPRVSKNAKNDRSTVPLMEGGEELDIRPTGVGGKPNVRDVLFALQNRAARLGHIEAGDHSPAAAKALAEDIAKEVDYHVRTSGKSAIGWYDEALKKAKSLYHEAFPELKTNKDAELLFDALLGITSQGNDVHSNSVFAARLYSLMRGEKGLSLPDAVKQLRGSFGQQTRAIEQNLQKFHDLVEKNGIDRMRELFNERKTVSEWNKILRTSPEFKVPGKTLKVEGSAPQEVTGWMVFGPKIGSFINNLHGDYSTLTADLWFSRTWNRLIGNNFIHSPAAEPKQYREYLDALRAEFEHHNTVFPWEKRDPYKTSLGVTKYDKSGKPVNWLHGEDVKDMSRDEFEKMIRDPKAVLSHAKDTYGKYWRSGYKEKSDLRRRAKNWMENRELPVAAPRGDKERYFQQQTVEQAQKILKKKYGKEISVADIQAALWFHEKEMFSKFGVAPERAQPADYADAAEKTLELIRNGDLYKVASKEKKAKGKKPPPEEPPDEPFVEEDEEGMARGGSILPMALRLADKYAHGH